MEQRRRFNCKIESDVMFDGPWKKLDTEDDDDDNNDDDNGDGDDQLDSWKTSDGDEKGEQDSVTACENALDVEPTRFVWDLPDRSSSSSSSRNTASRPSPSCASVPSQPSEIFLCLTFSSSAKSVGGWLSSSIEKKARLPVRGDCARASSTADVAGDLVVLAAKTSADGAGPPVNTSLSPGRWRCLRGRPSAAGSPTRTRTEASRASRPDPPVLCRRPT